jgi:hypothetical protein
MRLLWALSKRFTFSSLIIMINLHALLVSGEGGVRGSSVIENTRFCNRLTRIVVEEGRGYETTR